MMSKDNSIIDINDETVVIVGAGKKCTRICDFMSKYKFNNVVIIDNDPSKWGKTIGGYAISRPGKWQSKWRAYYISVAKACVKEEINNDLKEYGFDKTKEWSELEFAIYCYRRIAIKLMLNCDVNAQEENDNYFFVYRMPLGLGGVESWLCDIGENLGRDYGKRLKLLTGKTGKNVSCTSYGLLEYEFGGWDYYDEKKIEDILHLYINNRPTTICLNLLDESYIAAALAKLFFPRDISIISVVHNSTKKMIEANVSANEFIDKYCVVSDYIRTKLIEGGVDKKKIYYMSLPVAVDKELYRTYSSGKNPIRIGFAGRMDGFENSQKRMDLLIGLIDELNEESINFEFSFAGDGPACPELKRIIKGKNYMAGKVRFLGRIGREDIPNFWKEQDICINMADFEGHSISVSEAMANGAVPVVTDVSGVRDDIEDGRNGYIVSKGDYTEAVQKILLLYNDRKKLQRMGFGAHDVIYKKNRLDEHIVFWKKILETKEKI